MCLRILLTGGIGGGLVRVKPSFSFIFYVFIPEKKADRCIICYLCATEHLFVFNRQFGAFIFALPA